MAYIAVNKSGNIKLFNNKPERTYYGVWFDGTDKGETLPTFSDIAYCGKSLDWNDDPVELTNKKIKHEGK